MSALPEGLSDEEVLARYADEARPARERETAFRELMTRFGRRVHAICYRYFGSHDEAEEAAQETFVLLARRAGQFRGDSRLSTWIYRIATNACHDLARWEARRPRTPVADVAAVADPAGAAPSPAERVEADELGDRVREALLQLDELTRGLLLVCAVEGRPYADAAAAFGLPLGTVKSRVHRGRAKLATLLEADGDGPEQRSGEPTAPRRRPTDGAAGSPPTRHATTDAEADEHT